MTFEEKSQLIAIAVVIAVFASIGANSILFRDSGISFPALSLQKEANVSNGEALKPRVTEVERTLIKRMDEVIVGVVEKVSPAVVSVVATKDIPVIERVWVDPFADDPLFKQFFGDSGFRVPQLREKGTQKQQVSSGSGFIVSRDGLVVTNKHVVADTSAAYSVLMLDGSRFDADVLARDPFQDIAVLKIKSEARSFPFLALGDSENLKIGQTVIAIGNALGEFQNTVSVGIISGLHRSIVASSPAGPAEELREVIQTDAAINPGNSGGPLLNMLGEVIGVNTAIAQAAENIGFALPIRFAKKGVRDVERFGKIVYPFLGVRYVLLTDTNQKQFESSINYGALLKKGESGESAVYANSPAAVAGLQEGDIIIEFDGKRIDVKTPLASIIMQYSVGDTIDLKIFRNNGTITVSVTLTELPANL